MLQAPPGHQGIRGGVALREDTGGVRDCDWQAAGHHRRGGGRPSPRAQGRLELPRLVGTCSPCLACSTALCERWGWQQALDHRTADAPSTSGACIEIPHWRMHVPPCCDCCAAGGTPRTAVVDFSSMGHASTPGHTGDPGTSGAQRCLRAACALVLNRYWNFTASKRWDAQRKKKPFAPEQEAARPRPSGAPEQALQARPPNSSGFHTLGNP